MLAAEQNKPVWLSEVKPHVANEGTHSPGLFVHLTSFLVKMQQLDQ